MGFLWFSFCSHSLFTGLKASHLSSKWEVHVFQPWNSAKQYLGFEDNVLNISLEGGNITWDHDLSIS